MPPVACYGMLGNCRPVGGGVLTKDEVKRIMESLIGSTPSFTGCTVTAEFHRRPLPQLYVEALAPASDPRLLTIMVDQGTYRNMNDFSCSAVKVLADADSLKTHVSILSIDSSVCKLSGKDYSVHVPLSWITPSDDIVADWIPATDCDATVPGSRVRMIDELSRRRRHVLFHSCSNLDLSSRVSNLVGGQRPTAYWISVIPGRHQEMQRRMLFLGVRRGGETGTI